MTVPLLSGCSFLSSWRMRILGPSGIFNLSKSLSPITDSSARVTSWLLNTCTQESAYRQERFAHPNMFVVDTFLVISTNAITVQPLYTSYCYSQGGFVVNGQVRANMGHTIIVQWQQTKLHYKVIVPTSNKRHGASTHTEASRLTTTLTKRIHKNYEGLVWLSTE